MDACVILWATAGALIVRFGSGQSETLILTSGVPYVYVSLILTVLWWCMLSLWGSREPRVLGYGTEEYKRVINASFWLFGVVAILSYSLQIDTARGYVGVALPSGIAALLVARLLIRRFLHIERKSGRSSLKVLIVGGPSSVEHLTRSFLRQPMAGYLPVGAYLPGTVTGTTVAQDLALPTIGHDTDADTIVGHIRDFAPDAVALSSGVQLPPRTIRALGWALSDLNIRLIMAPALTDVAGPRIHTQPVAGLPLIHVSTPNLEKGQRFLKRSFDLVGALVIIVLLSPMLICLAALVRLDSNGPVFFRQERVGTGGKTFHMLKFRSMVVDAEKRLADMISLNEGNGVLFKIQQDPRVTKLGRVIRQYSLDELPQLFNVLGGSMSLVGPRPPLASEVEKYDAHVHRRLLVRPGMTGLWQVSGRSLLSWEDTVRLDLYYVENWSLSGDIAILLKTFRAVFQRDGAF
nr:sugar transferase [Arthrobacter sp. H5]